MNHEIIVSLPHQQPLRFTLGEGAKKLGQDPSCDLHVDHEEVAAHAANVERRAGAVLFQNLNPYVVYLGPQAVAPQAWVDWTPGDALQLTRSVALQLMEHGDAVVEEVVAAKPKNAAKSTLQIAVISFCALAGYLMLAGEGAQPASQKLDFDFASLVAEFEDKMKFADARVTGLSQEDRQILRYLQEAWIADVRWSARYPEKAIESYELLLNHHLVRAAEMDDTSQYGRLRMFAESRLNALGLRKKAG